MNSSEEKLKKLDAKVDNFMLKFGIIGSATALGAILGILAFNHGWVPWL